MDELKSVTKTTSVVKISSCVEQIYKKIVESRKNKIPDHNIKEIECLKSTCKSDNIQLSLMSVQTFVRLAENGTFELAHTLNLLISLLPNSTQIQYNSISEGVVCLLLLDLKRKAEMLKVNEKFQCPFGIKTQQHPLITLIQDNGSNMNDLANKITGICNHQDKLIQSNSIEYLRPVFLYILCNPQNLPDSKTLWTGLLSMTKTNPEAKKLILEIITWSKLSSPTTCLSTSILLIEALEHYENQNDQNILIELIIIQAQIVHSLIKFGIDPRPSLRCINQVLYSTKNISGNFYNVLLVLFAQTLHIISPIYLTELLRLISFIVIQQNCGNQYILNMCLDGVIQWMSQTAFIPADGLMLAHQIIQKIIAINKSDSVIEKTVTAELQFPEVKYFHPDISLAFDITKLVEAFEESEFKDVFRFVDSINVKTNLQFCQRMNLFLRAMFLSNEPSVDCWFKIFEILLTVVKGDENIAYDFLMTYIFKLSGEVNPEIQMELLRGLPSFAVSKDNIPMILNTLKCLSNGQNSNFFLDIYLRLWRVENRTYPFLVKLLSQSNKDSNDWESQIARTYTIREICFERPTQHGSELVSQLSNTLNTCSDENGDLATSLALDAIVALCDSNTVNITSTWKALSGKFRHEKRPRALKSLFNFFAHVPLLPSPTMEYEQLVHEALDYLWLIISSSDDSELIREAVKSLANFEIGTTMTIKHIPLKFKKSFDENIENKRHDVVSITSEYVPGECWVELLQKIKPDCAAAAADLISHYIAEEINTFRSGIYCLPEGIPEPRVLQGLYSKSPLRAVTKYLVSQSRFGEHVSEIVPVKNALRSISKKFSKPIPPLDWSFLHSFFHISFEMRKYCILIVKNQMLHSGTAKSLLENFLMDFEPNCFEEDLLLLFSLLPEIANGVNLSIMKKFSDKIALYCFKESQLNGFVEGCLFEKFLDSMKFIFMGKCDIPEVLDMFTLIIERYMDAIDLDSRLFEHYTEVVASLSPNAIDGLTSPATWWEKPIGKLKKATVIRCYLVLYNESLPNPLHWLNVIIDAFAEKTSDQQFFFRYLASTLHAFHDNQNACAWIMELFLQIQGLLVESSNKEKLEKALFLLNIFIIAADVFSGCAAILGNIDTVASAQTARLEIFGESLQLLCEHVFWKDNEIKIYEFLLYLYKNSALPETLTNTFKSAIICSRNQPFFDNKGIWTKYVGIRK